MKKISILTITVLIVTSILFTTSCDLLQLQLQAGKAPADLAVESLKALNAINAKVGGEIETLAYKATLSMPKTGAGDQQATIDAVYAVSTQLDGLEDLVDKAVIAVSAYSATSSSDEARALSDAVNQIQKIVKTTPVFFYRGIEELANGAFKTVSYSNNDISTGTFYAVDAADTVGALHLQLTGTPIPLPATNTNGIIYHGRIADAAATLAHTQFAAATAAETLALATGATAEEAQVAAIAAAVMAVPNGITAKLATAITLAAMLVE